MQLKAQQSQEIEVCRLLNSYCAGRSNILFPLMSHRVLHHWFDVKVGELLVKNKILEFHTNIISGNALSLWILMG